MERQRSLRESQLIDACESRYNEPGERRLRISLDLPVVRLNKYHYGEAARTVDMTELVREIGRSDSWDVTPKGFFATRKVGDSVVKVGTNFRSGVLEVKHPFTAGLQEAENTLAGMLNHIARASHNVRVAALAYGSHPVSKPSADLIVNNCKNRALENKLNEKFNYLGLVASEKVNVTVTGKEMALVNNVLNYYSPAIISLTANSSIIKGRSVGYADYRGIVTDMVDFRGKGRREANVGRRKIMPPISSMEEYVDRMLDFTPIYTIREGKPVTFNGVSTFREFIKNESTEVVFVDDGRRVKTSPIITPEPIDFYQHGRTCWTDARPRCVYGSIELNSASMQSSVREIMAVGALALGLAANAEAAWDGIKDYDLEYLSAIRRDAMEKGVSLGRFGPKGVITLETIMLDYAEEGLRKIGEDTKYLDPLRENCSQATSPAKRSSDYLRDNGMHAFIDAYRIKEE